MGQYYQLANLSKTECMEMNSTDAVGLKLMESAYSMDWQDRFIGLLTDRWHGDKVAYLGDYAWTAGDKFGRCGWVQWLQANADTDPYDSPDFTRLDPNMMEAKHYRFVVNETKNMYYDREQNPLPPWAHDDYWGRLEPLFIFLAAGNELGGGDYYGVNKELSGSWLGDTIYGTNTPPENMILIESPFKE